MSKQLDKIVDAWGNLPSDIEVRVFGESLDDLDAFEAKAVAYYFYKKYTELHYSLNMRKRT